MVPHNKWSQTFFEKKTNFLVANDMARESNKKQNIIKSNRWKYQNKNLHG